MTTPFSDYFSERSADYAACRPGYPPKFIAYLAQLAPAADLAWDAGTGNGQAARLLAHHFNRVIATDASDDQLANAAQHPRITYRRAREDDSSCADHSADLVTCAQALHWFDRPRFYNEVKRILKPRGLLAVWTYGRLTLPGPADHAMTHFYDHTIKPYWPPERQLVESGYQQIEFPFHEIKPDPWSMTADMTLDQFLGYIGTWSASARARKQNADPIAQLRQKISPHWPHNQPLTVTWPIAIRLGRT